MPHQDYRVRLHASNGSEVFNNDATWCAKPGLAGTGVSLESKNVPGRYLRHTNAELRLANQSHTSSPTCPGPSVRPALAHASINRSIASCRSR
ncbi:hypothetical protein ALI144C_02490 [Actinosynnema sp. ALI-1.44]|nr:hypothetical protein ALI144C_02490 [Actinosynnema sp. ALI-1.44]